MLKSIATSLPGWAIVIMLAILSFLLVNAYNDLRAQDESQIQQIELVKDKTIETEKSLSLVQQCLDIEMRHIKNQMTDFKRQQDQIYYMLRKLNGNHPGMEQ